MPKVSVVIPNYNHARFLRKRIDSILAQTFQDFELILLDDCSTDDSRSILSSYSDGPHVSAIQFNEENSGSTFKQWNKGVRLARGEYVWIAESDDYASERMLGCLVALLDADPKVAFAYCRSWRVSGDQLDGFGDYYLGYVDAHRWTADYFADGKEECRKYFVRVNPVPNASAVVFRRALYEQVGGPDESLRLCADWKLWAAMALRGRIAYLGEPLNYFRFHDASVRKKTEKMRLDAVEHFHVISWALRQVSPPARVLKKLYEEESNFWVPLLMSARVPFQTKRAILRYVREIDPHPLKRAVSPASTTVRLKLLRHWRAVRSFLDPSFQNGKVRKLEKGGISTEQTGKPE